MADIYEYLNKKGIKTDAKSMSQISSKTYQERHATKASTPTTPAAVSAPTAAINTNPVTPSAVPKITYPLGFEAPHTQLLETYSDPVKLAEIKLSSLQTQLTQTEGKKSELLAGLDVDGATALQPEIDRIRKDIKAQEKVLKDSTKSKYTKQIESLEAKKSELLAGLDVDGATAVQNDINALKREHKDSQKKEAEAITAEWRKQLAALEAQKSELTAGLDLESAGQLQPEIDHLKTLIKSGNAYDDTFTGQFSASYIQGRLSQEESKAWNKYIDSRNPADREAAQSISDALASFQDRNATTLDKFADLPWLSQTLAQYLPQLVDQTGYSLAFGGAGAAAGSMVPIVGTAVGLKAGIVAGSGLYSYNTMRGSAFKSLLDAGVDEELAREMATDEAIISALVEMAETGISVLTLGTGKLINMALKGGTSKLASTSFGKLAAAVGKYASRPGIGYVLNIGTEMLEEGTQQGVSIANRNRKAGGVGDLFARTLKVLGDAIADPTSADAKEIWEAAGEGGKIAAMVGGSSVITNTVARKALEADPTYQAKVKLAEVVTTIKSGEEPTGQQIKELETAVVKASEQVKAVDEAQSVPYNETVETDNETVLNRGASAYITKAGLPQAEAETAASIVQDLIDGKHVGDNQLKKLNLESPVFREVFTELTGVEFPEVVSKVQLRALARSAKNVAPETPSAQNEVQNVAPETPMREGVSEMEMTTPAETETPTAVYPVDAVAEYANMDADVKEQLQNKAADVLQGIGLFNRPEGVRALLQDGYTLGEIKGALKSIINNDVEQNSLFAFDDFLLLDVVNMLGGKTLEPETEAPTAVSAEGPITTTIKLETLNTQNGAITRAQYRDALRRAPRYANATDQELDALFDWAKDNQSRNGIVFDLSDPDLAEMQNTPWEEQIDNIDTLPTDTALYMADTPKALRDVGLGDLPMCMTVGHVQDAMSAKSQYDPHLHGIPDSVMKRLPELLANPAMILDSVNRYGDVMVVTTELDSDKLPIVVTIRPNGSATVGGVRGPANFITSVYGKTEFAPEIGGPANNNLLYRVTGGRIRGVMYWNRQLTENLLQRAGLRNLRTLENLPSEQVLKKHDGYRPSRIPERVFDIEEENNGRKEAQSDDLAGRDRAVSQVHGVGPEADVADHRGSGRDSHESDSGRSREASENVASSRVQGQDAGRTGRTVAQVEGPSRSGPKEGAERQRDLGVVPAGVQRTPVYAVGTDSRREVKTDKSATPQFKGWDAALLSLELGNLSALEVADPTALDIEVGYRVGGQWLSAGVYEKNAAGLAQFNADLPELIAKHKDAIEAEKQRQKAELEAKEKAKLESYTPVKYADPKTGKVHTFHTADLSTAKPTVRRMANLAKRLDFDFYVVPKSEIEAYTGKKASGVTCVTEGLVLVSDEDLQNGRTSQHEMWHARNMIDHMLHFRAIEAIKKAGLYDVFQEACEVAKKKPWGHLYDTRDDKSLGGADSFTYQYRIEDEVLAEASARSYQHFGGVYDFRELFSVVNGVVKEWDAEVKTKPKDWAPKRYEPGEDVLAREYSGLGDDYDPGIDDDSVGDPYAQMYSDPEYADPMYSKLYKVVSEYKGDKIGASSAISYLKGKGVKDEDIKWSGIQAFLEGKKSVDKNELLQYLRENGLKIDVEVLGAPSAPADGYNYSDNETGELYTFDSMREMAELRAEAMGYDPDTVLFDDYNYDGGSGIVWTAKDEDGVRHDVLYADDNVRWSATKWEEYTTDGGTNYREILFKLSGSDYTNQAMNVHWGREGVFAHARVQDFKTTDGKKVLFIEEIQSDWHNEGRKKGYATEDYEALLRERQDMVRKGRSTWTEEEKARFAEIVGKLYPSSHKVQAELDALRKDFMESPVGSSLIDAMVPGIVAENKRFGEIIDRSTAREYAMNKVDTSESVSELITRLDDSFDIEIFDDAVMQAFNAYHEQRDALDDKHQKATKADQELRTAPPDAPFRKSYHEYVLKHILREAAEKGYDYVGWTTGQMQEERWSSEYAEGYRIEYDQDIPKFLDKYGKQWGAKVGEIRLPNTDDPMVVADSREYLTHQLELYQRDRDEIDQERFSTHGLDSAIEHLRKQLDKLDGPQVWALPITESMARSVLFEGQPMFNIEDPARQKFVEEFDAIYGAGAAEDMIAAVHEAFFRAQDEAKAEPVTASSVGSIAQQDEELDGWVTYGQNPSVGAADSGFDPYSHMLNEYGAIKQTGKNNHRIADVPKSTNGVDRVSKTTTTVMGAKATPEKRLTDIASAVVGGKLSHLPKTDAVALNRARHRIKTDGFANSLAEWRSAVDKGGTNKDLVAMGATLLNNAGNSGMDGEGYVALMVDYSDLLTRAGQALQAANLFKKMTPEGRLFALTCTLGRLNRNVTPRDNVPVDEWMKKVGEGLAEKLVKKVAGKVKKAEAKTVCQTILADLHRFALESLPEVEREAGVKRTEMERITDLFRNYDQYQEAWEEAKQAVLEQYGKRPEILEFLDGWGNAELDYVRRLTDELTGMSEVTIDPTLAEQFLSAETDEAREAVMENILQNIADQIPASKMDKFTALRYTSMLANLRTMLKNTGGNVMMQPVRLTKTTYAALAEALLEKAGVDIQRSTSVHRDAETLEVAKAEFDKVREIIAKGGRYGDESSNLPAEIRKRQRIFKTAWLEGLRKGTTWMMDNEFFGDAAFSYYTFRDALSRYIAANHTTWSQAPEELKTKALEKAIKEAAEATYRDSNAVSDAITKLRYRNPSNWVEKGLNIIGEGVLPFRRTPANVGVRIWEYSPFGLLSTAVQAVRAVKGKNDMTGSDIVNELSKNLTGVSLVALGMGLKALGVLVAGAPDDEKEKELWEMQGHQEYALEIGNTSYTIDWAAPASVALFTGAELWEAFQEKGVSMRDALGIFSSVFDPMLEMSMLQGIDDALSNAQSYGDDSALVRFVGNALWSYVTQPIPTLLGQIERSLSNTRMTTYVDKNADVPDAVQRALGKASAKLPGWDYGQVQYIDAWGRTQENANTPTLNVIEQFISPGYASTIKETDMEKELVRLYKSTGDTGVLISRAPKYFTVNKERKDLTGAEYLSYAKTRGQTAFKLVTEITESKVYKSMDDATRAKAVVNAYDFANQTAKEMVTNGAAAPDKWVSEARSNATELGIPVSTYIAAKVLTNGATGFKDKKGDTVADSKSLQKMQALYTIPGLSDEQRKKLAEDLDVGKDIRRLSKGIVENRLKRMEAKYG